MSAIKDLLDRFNPGPMDVVGLDLRPSGLRAIRMRKGESGVSIVAADHLPPVNVPDPNAEEPEKLDAIELPPRLRAHYAALVIPDSAAIVKLLRFPVAFDVRDKAQVIAKMGLPDPDRYRLASRSITEAHGRSEARVLAVAVPEVQAAIVSSLLPSGRPAPYSVEVSGLAAIAACVHDRLDSIGEDAMGVVYFDLNNSVFAILNKGVLTQLRYFDVGTSTVLNKVHRTLGVDMETAESIVADGAFDISHVISETMAPLINQLIVCRDFVERHEGCHVAKLFVVGSPVLCAPFVREISATMEAETWEPFGDLTMELDAFPENLSANMWEFAAAAGACLGTLGEA